MYYLASSLLITQQLGQMLISSRFHSWCFTEAIRSKLP